MLWLGFIPQNMNWRSTDFLSPGQRSLDNISFMVHSMVMVKKIVEVGQGGLYKGGNRRKQRTKMLYKIF